MGNDPVGKVDADGLGYYPVSLNDDLKTLERDFLAHCHPVRPGNMNESNANNCSGCGQCCTAMASSTIAGVIAALEGSPSIVDDVEKILNLRLMNCQHECEKQCNKYNSGMSGTYKFFDCLLHGSKYERELNKLLESLLDALKEI